MRGGTKTKFFFGDNENDLGDYAWFGGNADSATHAVAKKKPNPYGLYDMVGNVWQWTNDRYESAPKAGEDPQGPTSGSGRVIRGGSWNSAPQLLRSASRYGNTPAYSDDSLGFRLVRTPK